jgi:hypothetical protein
MKPGHMIIFISHNLLKQYLISIKKRVTACKNIELIKSYRHICERRILKYGTESVCLKYFLFKSIRLQFFRNFSRKELKIIF